MAFEFAAGAVDIMWSWRDDARKPLGREANFCSNARVYCLNYWRRDESTACDTSKNVWSKPAGRMDDDNAAKLGGAVLGFKAFSIDSQ